MLSIPFSFAFEVRQTRIKNSKRERKGERRRAREIKSILFLYIEAKSTNSSLHFPAHISKVTSKVGS